RASNVVIAVLRPILLRRALAPEAAVLPRAHSEALLEDAREMSPVHEAPLARDLGHAARLPFPARELVSALFEAAPQNVGRDRLVFLLEDHADVAGRDAEVVGNERRAQVRVAQPRLDETLDVRAARADRHGLAEPLAVLQRIGGRDDVEHVLRDRRPVLLREPALDLHPDVLEEAAHDRAELAVTRRLEP